jgi:hypothetical protein
MPLPPWTFDPNMLLALAYQVPFGADPAGYITLAGNAQVLRPLKEYVPAGPLVGGLRVTYTQRFFVDAADFPLDNVLLSTYLVDGVEELASYIEGTDSTTGNKQGWWVITDVSPHYSGDPVAGTNLVDGFFISCQLSKPEGT